MKITSMLAAAGLVIASMGVSTVANAQDNRGDRQNGQRGDRDDRGDRGDRNERGDRGDRGRNDYRHDNGRHRGNAYGHRRCRTEYRHHRRVTVCYR